jgi:hypothetical protein
MAVRSVDVAQWGQVGCRTQGRSIVLLTNWDVGGQSCCILGYIIDNVEHALLVGRIFHQLSCDMFYSKSAVPLSLRVAQQTT